MNFRRRLTDMIFNLIRMKILKTFAIVLTVITASSCKDANNKVTSESVSEAQTEPKKKKRQ